MRLARSPAYASPPPSPENVARLASEWLGSALSGGVRTRWTTDRISEAIASLPPSGPGFPGRTICGFIPEARRQRQASELPVVSGRWQLVDSVASSSPRTWQRPDGTDPEPAPDRVGLERYSRCPAFVFGIRSFLVAFLDQTSRARRSCRRPSFERDHAVFVLAFLLEATLGPAPSSFGARSDPPDRTGQVRRGGIVIHGAVHEARDVGRAQMGALPPDRGTATNRPPSSGCGPRRSNSGRFTSPSRVPFVAIDSAPSRPGRSGTGWCSRAAPRSCSTWRTEPSGSNLARLLAVDAASLTQREFHTRRAVVRTLGSGTPKACWWWCPAPSVGCAGPALAPFVAVSRGQRLASFPDEAVLGTRDGQRASPQARSGRP